MAPDRAAMATEKDVHTGHRDQLAAYFRSHPFQVVTWETLEELVGRNYQQRVSEARRQLTMNIENVPRHSPEGKRLTGDYRFRPEALGRDGADFTKAKEQDLFTDLAGWQR